VNQKISAKVSLEGFAGDESSLATKGTAFTGNA
jgi:hypothetical protein